MAYSITFPDMPF